MNGQSHLSPNQISRTIDTPERSSILSAATWMVVISICLFFFPVINGLIAGLVGGYKAGSPSRALAAAVLPALVVAGLMWLLLAALAMPVIGLVMGVAVGTLIALSDLGLFVGAVIGGALSSRRKLAPTT